MVRKGSTPGAQLPGKWVAKAIGNKGKRSYLARSAQFGSRSVGGLLSPDELPVWSKSWDGFQKGNVILTWRLRCWCDLGLRMASFCLQRDGQRLSGLGGTHRDQHISKKIYFFLKKKLSYWQTWVSMVTQFITIICTYVVVLSHCETSVCLRRWPEKDFRVFFRGWVRGGTFLFVYFVFLRCDSFHRAHQGSFCRTYFSCFDKLGWSAQLARNRRGATKDFCSAGNFIRGHLHLGALCEVE